MELKEPFAGGILCLLKIENYLPICIGIIINFTKGDPLIRCPLLGQTKSGYPLGHTSPTIIAQMLTFVEHHPVGLFLWCQAQALLSLRQPLIDDSSSHGSPFRNFRNNRSEEHTSELQSLM